MGSCTIIEGGGSSDDIKGRIAQMKREIENSTSDYDKEKLQERLAKLAGGVAQINVGAASEVELKQKKAMVEDALHATRAAVEEGIVPGGGVSFLRAIATLKNVTTASDAEASGVEIVRRTLEVPLQTIAENAGERGTVVVRKVMQNKGNIG